MRTYGPTAPYSHLRRSTGILLCEASPSGYMRPGRESNRLKKHDYAKKKTADLPGLLPGGRVQHHCNQCGSSGHERFSVFALSGDRLPGQEH